MADVEEMNVKDLIDELHKYPDDARVRLTIDVDWCDNYGGGSAKLVVINGKQEILVMEVEE
jgi:hypothetical protein